MVVPSRRRRGGPRGWRLALVGVVVALLGWGAVGWHYSNRILGPDAPVPPIGQRILGHTDSTITLAANSLARRPGTWAITWPGGFGRIGPILSEDPREVVTRFAFLGGTPPDTTCRLAGFAVDADPASWWGWPFDPAVVPARSGPLPSWFLPGTDSTWAIFVHGRAATRAEVLRHLPFYRALGIPCLVLSYRNDRDGPIVDGGSYRLGATEWHDVEDAVRWAREHGARDVVLVGCSMGGATVCHLLRKSERRADVRLAVLDAPALEWRAVIHGQARQEGIPAFVTDWGLWCSAIRSGLHWDDLDQLRHAPEFKTPMLVFHGDADSTVPLELSRAFAANRPDLVTLHVVPGAGHVESANFDQVGYAKVLADWLREHGVGRQTAPDVAPAGAIVGRGPP